MQEVYFVQCSLAPINKDVTVEQNNPPGPALTELKKDLETNVGVNNMSVVLSFHYGYDEFSIGENWWNQEQRSEFKNTILAKYNVILMLTGHLHFYPNELYTIPVNVRKKTIYDVLSGTALYGGYSEISINPDNKKITIKRHDVNKNDDVVMNFNTNY